MISRENYFKAELFQSRNNFKGATKTTCFQYDVFQIHIFHFQTSEETDEMIAQTAIEMWIDDGCQINFEKQVKSNDVKSEITPSQMTPISNEKIDLIEPNFAMSTMIKIQPIMDNVDNK